MCYRFLDNILVLLVQKEGDPSSEIRIINYSKLKDK